MTCRDPNGAKQIVPLANAALKRRDLALTLLADEIGVEELRKKGLPVVAADVPVVTGSDEGGRGAAFTRARELLAQHQPDAIICGYSGPTSGLDEAMIAVAPKEITFLLQDFWGDINLGFGHLPGTVFVLDKAAESLTRRRFPVRTVVTGMPKFEEYAQYDVANLRARARSALGIGDKQAVIGLFGQPLWCKDAYHEAVAGFFATVRQLPSVTVLLRPHPRDKPNQLWALAQSLPKVLDAGPDRFDTAEEVLPACDIACSAYSSICHDMIVMNAVAAKPMGRALYYLPDALRDVYRKDVGHDSLPPVDAGLALIARTPDALRVEIESALNPVSREAAWRHIRNVSPDLGGATNRILDHVLAVVRERAQVA